jgi:hypothetical protein
MNNDYGQLIKVNSAKRENNYGINIEKSGVETPIKQTNDQLSTQVKGGKKRLMGQHMR